MGKIYVCGDTHGDNVERFSYKKHPALRELTEGDFVVVCGDTAIGWPDYDDTTEYSLEAVSKKPFTVLYLFGNHDNYDFAETLPMIDKFGGHVRQIVFGDTVYENQFIIDKPTILMLGDKRCLFIPGADSHDADELFYPSDTVRIKQAQRMGRMFRIIGQTWWPQEAIDINACSRLMTLTESDKFDYVFTHDCPAHFTTIASPHGGSGWRLQSTFGERYLQALANKITYTRWFHGHMHYDFFPYALDDAPGVDDNIVCLFNYFVDAADDLGDIYSNNGLK